MMGDADREVGVMGQVTLAFVGRGEYTGSYSAMKALEDFEKRSARIQFSPKEAFHARGGQGQKQLQDAESRDIHGFWPA